MIRFFIGFLTCQKRFLPFLLQGSLEILASSAAGHTQAKTASPATGSPGSNILDSASPSVACLAHRLRNRCRLASRWLSSVLTPALAAKEPGKAPKADSALRFLIRRMVNDAQYKAASRMNFFDGIEDQLRLATPLCQLNGKSPATIEAYVREVYVVAKFYGQSPDLISDEELERYPPPKSRPPWPPPPCHLL